jgi:hypothetical protein
MESMQMRTGVFSITELQMVARVADGAANEKQNEEGLSVAQSRVSPWSQRWDMYQMVQTGQTGRRERRNEAVRRGCNLRANQPSSSSLLVGAGSGAPGFSCVGN